MAGCYWSNSNCWEIVCGVRLIKYCFLALCSNCLLYPFVSTYLVLKWVENGSRVCSSGIMTNSNPRYCHDMTATNPFRPVILIHIHNDGSKWVNCYHVTIAWAAIGQLMIMVGA